MSDGILDQIEKDLEHFVPRNQREYVALQIARRFQDTHRLGRYLVVAKDHPKKILLEAARVATVRRNLNRSSLGDLFFEVLAEFDGGTV